MKTFKNNKGEEYLFIEIPEKTIITDKYNLFTEPYILEFKDGDVVLFEINKRTTLYKANKNLNKEETSIISTTKDITEKTAKSIIDQVPIITGHSEYKEYGEITWSTYPYVEAKESLQSLLDSLELKGSNYLILKKI